MRFLLAALLVSCSSGSEPATTALVDQSDGSVSAAEAPASNGKPPPTGTYFASCLMQASNREIGKTLSFWVEASSESGRLTLEMYALKLDRGYPPGTIRRDDIVGESSTLIGSISGDAFDLTANEIRVPGEANPLEDGKVLLLKQVRLTGRTIATATAGFCARMGGEIGVKSLVPDEHICLFLSATDGAPAPTNRSLADYVSDNCPR